MEERIYITNLYDCYGSLLTTQQQNYFLEYYFNNLSLSEISENMGVTRSAVHKGLIEAKDLLKLYEDKLKVYYKNTVLLALVKDTNLYNEVTKILES